MEEDADNNNMNIVNEVINNIVSKIIYNTISKIDCKIINEIITNEFDYKILVGKHKYMYGILYFIATIYNNVLYYTVYNEKNFKLLFGNSKNVIYQVKNIIYNNEYIELYFNNNGVKIYKSSNIYTNINIHLSNNLHLFDKNNQYV